MGRVAVEVAIVEDSPTILHLFQMIKGRLSRDLRMPLPLVALFQSSNYFFWLVYLRLVQSDDRVSIRPVVIGQKISTTGAFKFTNTIRLPEEMATGPRVAKEGNGRIVINIRNAEGGRKFVENRKPSQTTCTEIAVFTFTRTREALLCEEQQRRISKQEEKR